MSIPSIKAELERLYDGTATVYGYAYVNTGHGAKVKDSNLSQIYQSIPCRLSYDRKEIVNTDAFGTVVQEIVLFMDPSYSIEPGAVIDVTQDGNTQRFECAGLPAVYNLTKRSSCLYLESVHNENRD